MKIRDINITKKQFEKIKKWGIISILVIFAISKTPGYFKEKGSIEDITLVNLEESTDEDNTSNSAVSDTDSNTENNNESESNDSDIIENNTSSVDNETESEVVKAINSNKININTATSEELQELYRIGPAMAQKIIDYRTNYGDFTCIEEILEVNGIGDATYAKIKDYITVD